MMLVATLGKMPLFLLLLLRSLSVSSSSPVLGEAIPPSKPSPGEGSRHGMRGRGGLYERKVENERGKEKQTDRERERQREMNGYLHRCSCQCCGRLNHRICREYLRGWSHNHLGPATKTGSTQRQGEGEEWRGERE